SSPKADELSGKVKAQIQGLLTAKLPNPVGRGSLLPGTLEVIQEWESIQLVTPDVEKTPEWAKARIRLIRDLIIDGTFPTYQDHFDLKATSQEIAHARSWFYQRDDDNANSNLNRLRITDADFQKHILSLRGPTAEQQQQQQQQSVRTQTVIASTTTTAPSTQGEMIQQEYVQQEHAGEESEEDLAQQQHVGEEHAGGSDEFSQVTGEQTLNPVEKQVTVALLQALDLPSDQAVTPRTTYRELGGTSVQASRVLRQLNEVLGCKIQLGQFYRNNISIR
ncbi:MAG: hypothetical protein Q9226_008054, partial [Calogaya cf. arnoldii]